MRSSEATSAWYWRVLRPLWLQSKELLVFSLFINLLALATPIFILQVYDRVVFHAGLSTLQGLTIGMVLVIAFDFVLRQARARLMQRVSLRIDIDLGRRLFNKLTGLPLRALEARPTAHWQSLFRDAEQMRNLIGGPTAVLLVDLPFVILFISLIYVIAQPIVWVLVAALFAFVVLAICSSVFVQRASRTERGAGLKRDGLVAELIAGRATVKALSLTDAVRPHWERSHAETVERAVHRGGGADRFGNIGSAMAIAATVALTAAGAMAILDQQMTIGALIAANLLSSRIIATLNQLVSAWRNIATYRQSAQRLSEIFSIPNERSKSEVRLDRPHGMVSFEQVTFEYDPGGPPAIDGISFTVKPGGMHAIVGRNGSGKTTLLKLMQGLYPPTGGRVLLDGADIAQFTRAELAVWFGYVPQECFMFAGTLRDNIAIARPDATDEEIIEAARTTGVHDYIVDLPDGYATEIGEAGGRLSNGVRQRLAIARALVGDPPVVLLDEPTSNLDREAEEQLRNVLVGMARERDVVVVTHSPILLTACNNIIALERGKITLTGPAHEVMQRLFQGHQHRPPLERRA